MDNTSDNQILLLPRYSINGASSRYRVYGYAKYLEERGFKCKISALVGEKYLLYRYSDKNKYLLYVIIGYINRAWALIKASKYDSLYIEKELFPYMPLMVERFFLRKFRYALDYDDAVFHNYDASKYRLVRKVFSKKIPYLMRHSEFVVCGNSYIDSFAKMSGSACNVVVPTVVDLTLYDSVSEKKHSKYTIAWIGSPSTVMYLREVADALKIFSERVPMQLIVIGAEIEIEGVDVKCVKWSPDSEVANLKKAHVGIMPLPDKKWERGKCGFKLIQYMASKLPVVASPVGINTEIIEHGKNGFLARTQDEWVSALFQVRDFGGGMGERGYQKVVNKYNYEAAAPYLVSCFLNKLQQKSPRSSVANDFGIEWSIFDHQKISKEELRKIWDDYFYIFPWTILPPDGGVGVDIGCGSGRWAQFVAPRVKKLYLLDPSSKAIDVAKRNLRLVENTHFINLGVEELPFDDESLDFAYSLGVLHHVQDINGALSIIHKKLKKGAPFLMYVYYSMDNKPEWYRCTWKISDYVRRRMVMLPYATRYALSQIIAVLVYIPLIFIGKILLKLGVDVANWPLSYYVDKKFYTIRNDALDRFGTQLENRYGKEEIEAMLGSHGFTNIRFSEREPYWCSICIKN